ncbi:MAG TPA: CDP-alcohol phosphatidyltransferase family protein [Candidatus Peribacterales bacterium]|nr:CDP-alcohol phosphatidyltransferase family protein [Candidatus Peribacterales bacterium]
MPPQQTFSGDKKFGVSILGALEKKLILWIVPKVPQWIHTYHLTLSTLLWSGGIILFSFLARENIQWLWLVSLMIFFQYVTDSIDGTLGKMRNTGLVKWGFYMDHFLDYLFLCSILIGYAILLPETHNQPLFFILAVCGGFMVHSFLAFAATNRFSITFLGIGPTELRLLFIAINTILIQLGKTHLAASLPYVLGFCVIGLIVVVYKAQKEIWDIDMQNKK